MALVGESRVTEMLANVFFPLAIARDETRWIGFKNLRAPLTNRRVEVAALRLFGDSPRRREFLKSAALQQGLLQIYEDFCLRDASDCARCLFPQQLARSGERCRPRQTAGTSFELVAPSYPKFT